ncbi:hypothetical protein B0J12DRAFT_742602 [Macrophomina phaseolina]|uniref:Uncharacterized protein n=1 Tax=Macrophomina phaseolina TaxID=35725 RepID=A0ABQ8G6V0_9PEZI|nr:hypothetical protein B0J12DRAFT_742602 [Macrophomina phaseolina]
MFAATRAPSTLLRARPAAELFIRSRPSARMFHPTPRLPAMPKDPHTAHTVSQRVRQAIKGIPVEIYPLGKRAQHSYYHSHSSSSRARCEPISREQEVAEYVECATVAVIACGLSFGIYSFVRPARDDPTLRLHRSRPRDH